MGYVEFKYAERTRYDNLGRNGYSQGLGVALQDMGTEIHIRPVNSRGDLTQARVVIDKSVLEDVIVALMKMRDRPAADDLSSRPLLFRDLDVLGRKNGILLTDWLDADVLTAFYPSMRRCDVPAVLAQLWTSEYSFAINRDVAHKCISAAAERAGVALSGNEECPPDGVLREAGGATGDIRRSHSPAAAPPA